MTKEKEIKSWKIKRKDIYSPNLGIIKEITLNTITSQQKRNKLSNIKEMCKKGNISHAVQIRFRKIIYEKIYDTVSSKKIL